ncbi:MAG: penicillin-binding protein activator [Deltaproteobacteria bacterium]|uniref:Penicillin-binding protein activator n=1 Tax=Candidatus Zymogenus saltonus TaxID=2844893 RepID=A0A9D8KFZ2_9DELT|nr:penicillin-binding protein activator [Candidatus Zymogenus saltonus]
MNTKRLNAELGGLRAIVPVILAIFVLSSCITDTSGRGRRFPEPKSGMVETYRAAETDFKSGRYSEALNGYLVCIEEYPANTLTDNALVRAGDIYLARGDLSSARTHYLRVVQEFVSSDSYDEARYKLGYVYFKSEKYSDAVGILSSLVRESEETWADNSIYLILARSYIKLGDTYQAVYWFSEAIDKAADISSKSEAKKELKLLVEEYLSETELIRVSENMEGKEAGGYASYVLAKRYIAEGELEYARTELLKIVRNQPDHEYYYEAQGLLKETQGAPTSSEITVGVILPLSGRASIFGRRVREGLELASGSKGFTEGPKVKLIFRDSKGDATTASYAVKELAGNNDVALIIGPMIKEAAIAAAEEAQRQSIPIITLTKERDITDIGPYVFRNFLTYPDEIRSLVRYVIQSKGLSRFAILYPEDDYGKVLKELFSREVSLYGCSVVGVKSYTSETADFRATMKELISATGSSKEKVTFDAIFIPDHYSSVGMIVPYVFFYDLKGVTLLGTDGWNNSNILDITGDMLIGSYFADSFTPHSDRPNVKSFVEDFKTVYGKEPGTYEAYGYDTIKMIQFLMRTQGVSKRDEMMPALLSIRDYKGVTGDTTIERNGDSTKEPFILTVIEAEAKPTLTITEEPEEGVAIAAEKKEEKKVNLIIVEVPGSYRR